MHASSAHKVMLQDTGEPQKPTTNKQMVKTLGPLRNRMTSAVLVHVVQCVYYIDQAGGWLGKHVAAIYHLQRWTRFFPD